MRSFWRRCSYSLSRVTTPRLPWKLLCRLTRRKANTIVFDPVMAKFVRFVIHKSSRGQLCIDELEIYAPGGDDNLALASSGAKPSASSCLEGYSIHKTEHLNDGLYGNSHSWISAVETGWAQIELPMTGKISRVVFSRDREGRYRDRTPIAFEIQVSSDGRDWTVVKKVMAGNIVVPESMGPSRYGRQRRRMDADNVSTVSVRFR